MASPIADWSELCPEILLEIADRLGTRPNIFNFRQVCKNWRFPLSQVPRNLPHLSPLFPHRFCAVDSDFFSSLSGGTLHHLIADAVYLIRPRNNPEISKPWLVTVEEFYRGKLCVRFPLSRVSIRAKKHKLKNVNIPTSLNLFDFHVSVVDKGYSLISPGSDRKLSANGWLEHKNKLVLFANPACSEPLSIKDYTALMWFEDGRVAWVRLSRSLDWGFLGFKGTWKFDDIVNFNERVYAVDRSGKVYVVNYDSEEAEGVDFQWTLRMECIVSGSISSGCDSGRRKRLVVDSSGVLYLIEKRVDSHGRRVRVHFKVYKVDEERCKLDGVTCLGDDRILFVSVDRCFFANAADFPGCRGNSMVFSNDSFPSYGDDGGASIHPFFQGAKMKFEVTVFHFKDDNVGRKSAFPEYSDILWPPPTWL